LVRRVGERLAHGVARQPCWEGDLGHRVPDEVRREGEGDRCHEVLGALVQDGQLDSVVH
jgi:hypothetical protein